MLVYKQLLTFFKAHCSIKQRKYFCGGEKELTWRPQKLTGVNLKAGNTKGGSNTVALTSCLSCMESAV
jgi:hypothetical protein